MSVPGGEAGPNILATLPLLFVIVGIFFLVRFFIKRAKRKKIERLEFERRKAMPQKAAASDLNRID